MTKKNQPEIKLNEEADELHLSEMMDSFVLGLNVSVHIEHTNLHQHTHTHYLFLFYLFTLSFVKHTHTRTHPHTPHIIVESLLTAQMPTKDIKKHLKLNAPDDVPVHSPEEMF